jgi:aspartate aminotransferase
MEWTPCRGGRRIAVCFASGGCEIASVGHLPRFRLANGPPARAVVDPVTWPRLSRRSEVLEPSATIALDTRAKELLASGVDVVNLSIGEPDQHPPTAARLGAVQAIASGVTGYTPTAGTTELRRAICEKLWRQNSVQYRAEEIVVSAGAKQALFNALMVLVDVSDQVLIPAPYWATYPQIVRLAGGVPVIIDTSPRNGYRLTPEALRAAIGPRTRGLVLNNPTNPTGAVYDPEELERIARVAVENRLFIISDEIYERLTYESAKTVSVASLGRDVRRATVTVNGFSKAFAMTGWRLGYAAAAPAIARAMADLQSQVTSCPSSISQEAGRAALADDARHLQEMRRQFDERRRYVLDRLATMPGITVDMIPRGAFYVFPDVSACFGRRLAGHLVEDARDLATVLLECARVAVVPGEDFGGPGHIRISYATSMERLEEGMDRLARLLASAEV